MRLNIFTIVLDGLPFIAHHLPVFNQLRCDWHWSIAEGAAMNVKDTSWCQPQQPRLSWDGTTEYLTQIKRHPRITVVQRQSWQGKVEMVNALLPIHKEECVLMQVDADELWTPDQLERIVRCFEAEPGLGSMQFYCRYFVGQNIVITSDNTYGNHHGEWMRAWRWLPGSRFMKHEPPLVDRTHGRLMSRGESREMHLVFDHMAYVLPQQVAYKEAFYGYQHAGEHWKRLQANRQWPVKLSKFLPWIEDDAEADLLWK